MTIIPRVSPARPDAGLTRIGQLYYAVWTVGTKQVRRTLRTHDLKEARAARDTLFAALLRKKGSRVALKGGRPRKEKP